MAAQQEDPASLLQYCRTLNHLRQEIPGLAAGKTTVLTQEEPVCVLEKRSEAGTCYAAISFSAKESAACSIPVPGLTHCEWLLAEEGAEASVQLTAQGAELLLPPYGVAVLYGD